MPGRRGAGWHDGGMAIAVVTFAAAAALLILVPGPDNALVVRNALRGGPRVGRGTAAGVLTGLVVWAAAAVLGLSALLRASHLGYDVLRYAGALYLLWLGVSSLRSKGASLVIEDDQQTNRPRAAGVGYLTGVTTNLFNPKVGVFFVSFLPAFVPRGAPVGATSLLFGAMFVIETAVWFAALLALVGRGAAWLRRPRVQQRLGQLSGLVLMGFGLRLATEHR